MLHNKHNYSQVSCWSVYIHTDPNVAALGRVSFCIRCEFLRSGWDQHCLLSSLKIVSCQAPIWYSWLLVKGSFGVQIPVNQSNTINSCQGLAWLSRTYCKALVCLLFYTPIFRTSNLLVTGFRKTVILVVVSVNSSRVTAVLRCATVSFLTYISFINLVEGVNLLRKGKKWHYHYLHICVYVYLLQIYYFAIR